jgi:D-alanyl-lipoteichoic acid acyltransferase DltB (MBOAT superfamily)
MLFNSYIFLVFLALVLLISRAIRSWSIRKFFLLLVSYVFYAAWNPPFVVLLWLSTFVDWFIAKWIYQSENQCHRKFLVVCSLLVNLGLLAFFKYGNFILDNISFAAGLFNFDWNRPEMNIILPVGISFYTFQTLSYTLDVYRREMPPAQSFLDYALYVTFFPQLVAGPIVRAVDFVPQCIESKKGSAAQIGWGLTLLVIGLFSKVVVADALMSPYVEVVYDKAVAVSFLDAWLGTFAFAVQIFCDFAGYSTCAIGVALCLGFDLPDNFRFPYAAVGFSDFWSRWHISLSSWLRDYLYISMGGNRKGVGRTYINLMLTMLIGGLWHGASWLFVIWGGLHGAYLVGERGLRKLCSKQALWKKPAGQIFLSGITFLLVCIAWVFFRAGSMETAKRMLSAMFNFSFRLQALGKSSVLIVVVTGLTLLIHWLLRHETLESVKQRIPWPIRSLILAGLMVIVLMFMNGDDGAFIYFQF